MSSNRKRNRLDRFFDWLDKHPIIQGAVAAVALSSMAFGCWCLAPEDTQEEMGWDRGDIVVDREIKSVTITTNYYSEIRRP